MKIKRPLVNPTPRDMSEQYSTESKGLDRQATQIDKRSQITLDIDTKQSKLQQIFSTVKFNIQKKSELVEVSKFWKSPAIPFMIVTTFFNIGILFLGGLLLFGKLPSEIQLFYNPVDKNWSPETKIVHVVFLPIILTISYLVLYRILKYVFVLDRRLALSIAWVVTFLNVLLLVAIGQIYQLNPV